MPDDPQTEQNDKVYSDEAAKSVGKLFGHLYKGMLETGMPPAEAERALHIYIHAFVTRPTDPPKEDKDA